MFEIKGDRNIFYEFILTTRKYIKNNSYITPIDQLEFVVVILSNE